MTLCQFYQYLWLLHPVKINFSLMILRKILPRIVFVSPRACFQIVQLVSQFRHRRNDWWQHEQHLQPIRAKKNLYRSFLSCRMTNKKILPRIFVVGAQPFLHIHCSSLQHLVRRHPRGLLQNFQPRGLMYPKKINFLVHEFQEQILPRIVFVVLQTNYYMHCASFHFFHQGGLWQRYQPREPMHPIKINFLAHESWPLRIVLPRIVALFLRAYFQIVPWNCPLMRQFRQQHRHQGSGELLLRPTYP